MRLPSDDVPTGYAPSSEQDRIAWQAIRNIERLYAWELRHGMVKLLPLIERREGEK